MQTRATLALCPCICAIYNFEKYCVVLCFKSHIQSFSLLCAPPPQILFTISQTFTHELVHV